MERGVTLGLPPGGDGGIQVSASSLVVEKSLCEETIVSKCYYPQIIQAILPAAGAQAGGGRAAVGGLGHPPRVYQEPGKVVIIMSSVLLIVIFHSIIIVMVSGIAGCWQRRVGTQCCWTW